MSVLRIQLHQLNASDKVGDVMRGTQLGLGMGASIAYHERSQISVPLLHGVIDFLNKLSSLSASPVGSLKPCVAIQIGLVGVSETARCAGSRTGADVLRSFISDFVKRGIIVETCSLNVGQVCL